MHWLDTPLKLFAFDNSSRISAAWPALPSGNFHHSQENAVGGDDTRTRWRSVRDVDTVSRQRKLKEYV